MAKLVYENLAIGVIIQRLGECNMRNKPFMEIQTLLSQQTPLEKITVTL